MVERKNKGGRPPSLPKQTEELARKVKQINDQIDSGLVKLANEYEPLIDRAVEIATGNYQICVLDRHGDERWIQAQPSPSMMATLLKLGIQAVERTGGSGPESPAQRILQKMSESAAQLVQNNYYISQPNLPIVERDSSDSPIPAEHHVTS